MFVDDISPDRHFSNWLVYPSRRGLALSSICFRRSNMSVNSALTLLAIFTYFRDKNIHTSHFKQIQILV